MSEILGVSEEGMYKFVKKENFWGLKRTELGRGWISSLIFNVLMKHILCSVPSQMAQDNA